MSADESAPGLVLSGIAKAYGLGRAHRSVVAACDLVVPHGMTTAMIGPSGCGKSTIARLIAGYQRPDAGTITLDGRPVKGPGRDRLMVFQENALFSWMRAEENVLFGLRQSGQADAAGKRRTRDLLAQVGLGRFAKSYPDSLSGGMQRRLEVVRALVNEPQLLILDEPFRGLDAMTRALMQEHLADLMERTRRTTLLITTDVDEAILLADRIVVMTNRPTRVATILSVDLPRPRRIATIVEDDAANALKAQLLEVITEFASLAFRQNARLTLKTMNDDGTAGA